MENSIRAELENQAKKLTTNITYAVLGGFMLLLAVILAKAMDDASQNSPWFRLFKDGFLLLGGVLTTLIGYYFGNRGSEATLKEAENEKMENQKILEKLEELSPTREIESEGIVEF